MTTTLRVASANDAAIYRTIRLAALANAPDAFGTQYANVAERPLAHWANVIRSMAFLVLAMDEETVVGTASGGDFIEPGVQSLGLFGMYVEPARRGTGVADDLVRAVARWAHDRGGEDLRLHVTEGNDRAIAFYRRLGFAETERWRAMPRDHRVILREMMVPLPLEPVC